MYQYMYHIFLNPKLLTPYVQETLIPDSWFSIWE